MALKSIFIHSGNILQVPPQVGAYYLQKLSTLKTTTECVCIHLVKWMYILEKFCHKLTIIDDCNQVDPAPHPSMLTCHLPCPPCVHFSDTVYTTQLQQCDYR